MRLTNFDGRIGSKTVAQTVSVLCTRSLYVAGVCLNRIGTI